MLDQTKRLYDLGFAIHLIKPKSKMPIKPGWTSTPKESWASLEKSYKKEMNVGVRLGRVSMVGKKFLAVIDCDVKSKEEKHLDEMNEKLKTLLGERTTPCVLSGRGNGSKHFYVLTEQPLTPKRFAQSSEKVKVLMPSVAASKHELQVLTAVEIKKGIRFRPAWEISLMGEGQQVVLPPSIHPDSGKAYEWFRAVSSVNDFMTLDHESVGVTEAAKKTRLNDFKAVPFDLYMSDLQSTTVDLIVKGEGCEDRSAALFGVVKEMIGVGFSEAEILSCLTDSKLYLGACAFDHAKTESRKRAAEWVYNFTFKKAKRDALLEEEFNEEVIELEFLSDEKALEQEKELIVKDTDWRKNVKRNKTTLQILNTFHNIKTILCGVMDCNNFLTRNEFAYTDTWTIDTPWGSKKGVWVSDDDCVLIKGWLSQKYGFEPAIEKINEVVTHIALKNAFHPVRDWLVTLKWDGKPRLDTWLKKYLNADEHPKYLEVVGRRFVVGMVGRILQPGVKFDQALIFEGEQGVGKSSAASILASPEYFSDTELPIGDKDAVMNIQGVWVHELGELAVFNRADTEKLKNFITQPVDKIRPPHGRRTIPFPRQTVFIGTTNRSEYLKDDSGERRWWPVKIGQVKFDLLREDREQLFAEAVEAFQFGEPINEEGIKDDKELKNIFEQTKARRKAIDHLEESLQIYLDSNPTDFNTESFRITDLMNCGAEFLRGLRDTTATQMRLASALKKLGYSKTIKWHGKSQFKTWVKV